MNLFGEIEVNNEHDAYTWIRWKWNRYNSLVSNWMETKIHYLRKSCHIFYLKLERLVFKGIPLSTKKSDPVTLKYNDKMDNKDNKECSSEHIMHLNSSEIDLLIEEKCGVLSLKMPQLDNWEIEIQNADMLKINFKVYSYIFEQENQKLKKKLKSKNAKNDTITSLAQFLKQPWVINQEKLNNEETIIRKKTEINSKFSCEVQKSIQNNSNYIHKQI